jgi:PAS domain S-box-containing protein
MQESLRPESVIPTPAPAPQLTRDFVEAAMEDSGVGIWDWNIATGHSSYTPFNRKLLGYGEDESLGSTFEELAARLHPEDALEMRERVERYLRGETPAYVCEFRVARKDGSYAWFESRGVVVQRGAQGEPLRMIGIHLDISHRKENERLRRELEAALRASQEELRQLVRLQSAKLVEAAEAAEHGNRAKNALLANVGRELGAPLATLADECETLLRADPGELPKSVRDGFTRICEAGRQLAERIGRLLDVSSIESNTLEIIGTPVDVRWLLEEQCEALRERAQDREIELRAPECPEDLVVFADRARFAQVVRELLENAIRYTNRGHVRVRARPFDGWVMIEVLDTGPGIPTEQQATLFHAFRPLANGQRRLCQGLGLGLSISRAVVDAMGGTMGVASMPGRGSRFWFTLPLAASVQRMSQTRH